jgi:hypothetical protein
MVSQSYTGRGQLINRLASQVGSRKDAIAILIKRGHLEKDGKTLTPAGMARDAMTAEERAKDRASKKTGDSPNEFKYNPKTNRVRKIK